MRVASLLLAVLIAGTGLAAADDRHDVQTLLDMCKQPAAQVKSSICIGYISGVADLMRVMAVSKHKDVRGPFGMCHEGEAPSRGAMMQAFIVWADKHPEEWQKDMLVGVVEALSDTWRCGT
jgi:hypothetical protein